MRILGLSRQEILDELRPFNVPDVPASGPYLRRVSLVQAVLFLISSELTDNITLDEVKARIDILFS